MAIADFVKNHADKIADSRAIQVLGEIQEVIRDDGNTDFDAI